MFYINYIKLCNKNNISPSAAAEEMGFQRSSVTRWSKHITPRLATLQKIADYFGVPVSELTEDPDEKKPTPEGELTEQDIKLLLSKMSVNDLWDLFNDVQNELRGRSSDV